MSDESLDAPIASAPEAKVGRVDDAAEAVRELVRPLAEQRDAVRAALRRAEEDLRRGSDARRRARSQLADAERDHATALAASYRAGSEAAGDDLRQAEERLRRARDRVAVAGAEIGQSRRVIELLRGDLERASERLRREATEAKARVVGELRERLGESWAVTRSVIDQLRAVGAVEAGENPPYIERADRGTAAFERTVVRGEAVPSTAPKPGPGVRAVRAISRFVLTVLGGAAMIVGGMLEWIDPPGLTGLELDWGVYLGPEALEVLSPNRLLAGILVVVLGVLSLVGLAFRSGLLTRIAATLGLAAFLLVVVTMYRAPEIGLPDSIGAGLWTVLAGSVVALAGGIVARRAAADP